MAQNIPTSWLAAAGAAAPALALAPVAGAGAGPLFWSVASGLPLIAPLRETTHTTHEVSDQHLKTERNLQESESLKKKHTKNLLIGV
jgi:hypothetical protein